MEVRSVFGRGERPLRTDSPRRLRPNAREGCPRLERGDSPPLEGRPPTKPPRGSKGRTGKPGRLRRKSDLEGDTSPWKERAIQALARVSDATDPFAEQSLEVEGLSWQTSPPPTGNGKRTERPLRDRSNVKEEPDRGDTVRLRTGGTLRRVGGVARSEARLTPASTTTTSRWPATLTRKRGGLGLAAMGAGFSETRRTPGPAAGCNKPAGLRAEKTVEVVRNHAGGTGAGRVVPSARR
jgi:hypothetical protein